MTMYKDFERDFLDRTKKILEQYDKLKSQLPENEQFEVTLLTNSLFGLCVIPFERLFKNQQKIYAILNGSFVQLIRNLNCDKVYDRIYLEKFDRRKGGPLLIIPEMDITVYDFIEGIRHSIAHGSITYKSGKTPDKIEGIFFESVSPAHIQKYTKFNLEINVELLRLFVEQFYQYLIDNLPAPKPKP